MNGDGQEHERSRCPSVAAIAPIVLLLAACGTGTPSNSTSTTPTAAASSSIQSGPPTGLPTASALAGRLPIGRVVVDRLDGSPEGDFLGAFVLGIDGAQTPLKLPVSNMAFTGTWSPDGARLLVDAFTGDRLIVGTFDPATSTYAEIRPDGMVGEVECTDWTPDANRVICARGGADPKKDGIYTVDVASGATTRLTTSPFHHVVGTAGECGGGEGRAVYSADGSRFAYVQQKCGAGADPSSDEVGAIAVALADGSNEKVIVPFGGVRTHAGGEIAWSPTDDAIAFGTQDGKLSVVGADGTGLRTIDLPTPGFVYGPAWSPDGKWLLVTVVPQATGRHDLFVVPPDGSTMVQVTDTPEVEAFTDWGAAP
jgi:Tol biopolymer transport system component